MDSPVCLPHVSQGGTRVLMTPAQKMEMGGQETEMLVPLTVAVLLGSGVVAGPCWTDPSVAEKWLPWHGQMIAPFTTEPTMHP